MKSYFDCLNELSSEELFEGLLAYGLFNSKLPPIFTSHPFYDLCVTKNMTFNKEKRDWTRFDNNRNNSLPRQLGIPNPFAYYYQCCVLRDNWTHLLAHFKSVTGQPYKISRDHIRKMRGTRRLFQMNYGPFKTDGRAEPNGIVSSKYIVKTDISNCYGSIYTHAIGWAMIGKPKAKSLKQGAGHYTQAIDESTRNTSYGETHGILIGPDSSSLISEIVLCAIDQSLFEQGFKFIRHIDDYSCYVDSIDQGKRFISSLRKALLEYDLSINEKKTKIVPISEANHDDLGLRVHQLDYLICYQSDDYKKVKYAAVVSYFNALDRLCLGLDNNLSVYLFALKILQKKDLTISASRYVVEKALNLSINNPYLLPSLKPYVFDKYGITESLKEFCEKLYSAGIEDGNYEKAVYSLYFAITNGISIDTEDDSAFIDNSEKCNDCLLRLMSWLYCKKTYGKTFENRFYNLALGLSKDGSEFDRNWVFVYEVLKSNDLMGDWQFLKREKISFIDSKALKTKTHWRTAFYK